MADDSQPGGLLGTLFGGGDLYGNVLAPEQKRAMVGYGLLAMGAKIAAASAPSRLPSSPLGAFAQGGGAFGEAEQEAARNAMQGTLLGYQGQLLHQRLGAMDDFRQNMSPGVLAWLAGGAPPGAGPSGVAAAPSPGAVSGLISVGGIPAAPSGGGAPEASAPVSPQAGRPALPPSGAWPFPGPPQAPTTATPYAGPMPAGPGAPPGPQLASAAPLPPGGSVPSAPGGGLLPGGGIDPRALWLAAQGSRAQAAGLGDIMKPFETAFYGSPGYQGLVEGAKAGAKAGAELPFAGPTAYAKAAGEGAGGLPYKITTVRPGSTALQGTRPIYTAPTQVSAVDAEGNARPAFIAPPGSPSPYASGGGGPGPITKLGPGVTTGLEARAKAEQESRQATIEQGGAAQAQQATLTKMRDDAANFYTGPFAEHVQEAKSFLRLIPGASEDVVNSVAKYEDFTKNAGQLIRQAVKEQSPRAAVQEFKLITAQLPNPEMSPVGLRMVTNELMGLNDYRIAKAQAQTLYEQRAGSHGPGDVTNFETMWQANVSPYAFMVQRMDPGERQALVAKLNQSAEGKGEIAHLYQQMQFITKSGLHNFLQ